MGSCTNCNCGKAEKKDNIISRENPAIDDSFNRLYLLGYLSNPSIKLIFNDADEILAKELVDKFPDDVILENNIKLKIITDKLINFFDKNKNEDYLPLNAWLSRLPRNAVKHFWRGYIDFTGQDTIGTPNRLNNYPKINLEFYSENMLESFLKFLGISECDASIYKNGATSIISINYSEAFDLLSELYSDNKYIMSYNNWSKYIISTGQEDQSFKFMRKRPDAVAPFKSRASDSGYDLTILEKVKTVGDVEFYDTGIVVIPAYSYYFDVVPRSSISKTGYMLANSVGVIDMSYRGNILVPLRKVNKNAPDLELPNRIVQIIPRKIIHIDFQEVQEFTSTNRGEGGFGSSDFIK